MKKKLIFLLFIAFYSFGWAQENSTEEHTIKGKVINLETNEAISFTNIGIEGTLYGTASDEEGNFQLKIPAEYTSKNIFFSAVGYQNKTIPAKDLFNHEFNIIKLESQSYGIEDINIAAQSKVLIRILRMAAENTPYNFIGGPFNLLCSYEKNVTDNDTSRTVQEANVTIYDKNGYSSPSKADAFQSVKYSVKKEGASSADYRFSTGLTNVDELLNLDWVRTSSSILNPGLLDGFQFSLDSEPEIDGNPCWVISFKQSKPTLSGTGDFYAKSFEGKITIKKDDYSVKKIEGQVYSDKNSFQGRSIIVNNSSINVQENVTYHFAITYANLKPESIELNKQYTDVDNKKTTENSSLKINRVLTTNITALDSRDYFIGD